MESLSTGTLAGTGTFRCEDCGYTVSLAAADSLPACPSCGGTRFLRASLFATGALPADPIAEPEPDTAVWLANARALAEGPGQYVAFEDRDETRVLALDRDWMRVGRSLAADLRFDDPTVSRRHALFARHADGIRVLDDRSLNGVFVNGSRVESRTLEDGDEIIVGRHRLHFFELVETTTPPAEAAAREQ